MEEALSQVFSEGQAWVLFGLQFMGVAVWRWQSRPGALGGPISIIKAFWLVYAISLWIVVPCMLWTEHWAFVMLAVSMLIRAIVEAPLCLTKRWKVRYGVMHDGVHLILTSAALVVGILERHAGVISVSVLTFVSLLTELLFVYWFRKYTDGPEAGIYFVPDEPKYEMINVRTFQLLAVQMSAFAALLVLNLIPDFPSHGP